MHGKSLQIAMQRGREPVVRRSRYDPSVLASLIRYGFQMIKKFLPEFLLTITIRGVCSAEKKTPSNSVGEGQIADQTGSSH
jgi:hypothetical protein